MDLSVPLSRLSTLDPASGRSYVEGCWSLSLLGGAFGASLVFLKRCFLLGVLERKRAALSAPPSSVGVLSLACSMAAAGPPDGAWVFGPVSAVLGHAVGEGSSSGGRLQPLDAGASRAREVRRLCEFFSAPDSIPAALARRGAERYLGRPHDPTAP